MVPPHIERPGCIHLVIFQNHVNLPVSIYKKNIDLRW